MLSRATGLGAAFLATFVPAALAVEPVRDFDAERYLGTWYEIAAIPAWFQRGCVAGTRATYTATAADAEIGVLNACVTEDGTVDRAIGRARFTGAADVGALEVTFVEIFGAYRWFAGGAYVVIALDRDYRWSAVAHPSTNYAWILAREPRLDLDTLAVIHDAYAAAGYDTCRLLTSPQTAGAERVPLCELVAAP